MNIKTLKAKLIRANAKLAWAVKMGCRLLARKFVMIVMEIEAMIDKMTQVVEGYNVVKLPCGWTLCLDRKYLFSPNGEEIVAYQLFNTVNVDWEYSHSEWVEEQEEVLSGGFSAHYVGMKTVKRERKLYKNQFGKISAVLWETESQLKPNWQELAQKLIQGESIEEKATPKTKYRYKGDVPSMTVDEMVKLGLSQMRWMDATMFLKMFEFPIEYWDKDKLDKKADNILGELKSLKILTKNY